MNILIGFAVLVVLGLIGRFIGVPLLSPQPDNLGVQNGALGNCPSTPNCVSSSADPSDRLHYIAPLALSGTAQQAHDALLAVINSLPRSVVITDEPTYIHAEFRSLMWGFIDDVEFYIDETAGQIQMRSAARLGAGDAGVNRNRIETIRALYQQS